MLEKLQEIIADKLGIEASEIKPESKFSEDLGADSLDLFEVVMGLEEAFDISIDNEDLDQIKTVQDAMDYIAKKQA
ncbi:MAG: acyl carrier protein [Candidatus Cellulosilyticum pullistercoris]|uniref:Acyl carrier protein n=1 Tax=Candidatus Cellulosilyticum pullistercoris TaxID=2838521 RepID=A0A9E2KCZ7_9FIRM|nr:acyl carrier protein [Candidatus Cellulosilyticum pullistercoris]